LRCVVVVHFSYKFSLIRNENVVVAEEEEEDEKLL
jgi:hypothetical protein